MTPPMSRKRSAFSKSLRQTRRAFAYVSSYSSSAAVAVRTKMASCRSVTSSTPIASSTRMASSTFERMFSTTVLDAKPLPSSFSSSSRIASSRAFSAADSSAPGLAGSLGAAFPPPFPKTTPSPTGVHGKMAPPPTGAAAGGQGALGQGALAFPPGP